ncbi:MAG: hypothetical protein AAFQ37_00345, partial [Bacteroidota bacterium]
DPTVLTWNGVFLTGAWPGLTADDFVDTGSGRINVSWQTDTGPGFIPDSSVVFELCFNTLSTPGCFPIEAFSDAQPSATTTGGDGSILFTDGEVCIEDRIKLLNIAQQMPACSDVCNGTLVINAEASGANAGDLFVRLENPLRGPVAIGDTFFNICPGWNVYTIFNTGSPDLVLRDSVFVEFDQTQVVAANAADGPNGDGIVTLSCVENASVSIGAAGNIGEEWNLYRIENGMRTFITEGEVAPGGSVTVFTPFDGCYVLEVINAAGCTAVDTVKVQNPVLPTLPTSIPMDTVLSCEVESITLDGTIVGVNGTPGYQWQRVTLGEGTEDVGASPTYTIDSAGRYRLIVTILETQCRDSIDIVVGDLRENAPNINIADAFLGCDGSEALVCVPNVDGYVYAWKDADGTVLSSDTCFSTSVVGTYTLCITDPLSGCEAIQDFMVSEPTGPPVIGFGESPQPLDCTSDTLILTPIITNISDNSTFLWTTTDCNIFIGDEDVQFPRVIGTGTYVLTVDNGGCTDTDSLTVIDPVLPTATVPAEIELSCTTTTTIDGTNGSQMDNATYLWLFEGDTIPGENTLILSVTQPGVYTLEITDTSTGCQNTAFTTVVPPANFPTIMGIADTVMGLSCANDSLLIAPTLAPEGSYTLEISGPGNPIVNPENSLSVLVFEPGEYVLSATNDNSGCTAEQSFFVDGSQLEPPFAALTRTSI